MCGAVDAAWATCGSPGASARTRPPGRCTGPSGFFLPIKSALPLLCISKRRFYILTSPCAERFARRLVMALGHLAEETFCGLVV